MSRRALMSAACVLATLAAATPAGAATYSVTNGSDSGPGSLRDALTAAAAANDPDVVAFDGAYLVVLTSPLPEITGPVAIAGNGSVVRGSAVRLGGGGVAVSRLGVEPPHRLEASGQAAPAGVGVRRLSDGILRMTGTVPAPGALELFGAGGANYLSRHDGIASGPFAVPIAPEPQPGQALTVTLTTGAGTSGFAHDFVPNDLTSPVITGGRTVDADGDGLVDVVRLSTSEGLADASGYGGVALSGVPFALARTGARVDDDEFDVALTTPLPGDTSPEVRVAANASLADLAGNQLLAGTRAQVIDDVAPEPVSALANSRTSLRVNFSEPVVGTLRLADLELTMAGTKRTLRGLRMTGGGRSLELDADPAWPYAAAGEIRIRSALADALGNRSDGDRPVLRVWAAPGDTTPPSLRSVKLNRKVLCARGVSRRCKRSGGTVRFTLNESATVALDLRRGRSTARSSLRIARSPGAGSVSFGDRVEGRRVLPGTYTLTVFAIDAAGNESRPRVLRFRVRR